MTDTLFTLASGFSGTIVFVLSNASILASAILLRSFLGDDKNKVVACLSTLLLFIFLVHTESLVLAYFGVFAPSSVLIASVIILGIVILLPSPSKQLSLAALLNWKTIEFHQSSDLYGKFLQISIISFLVVFLVQTAILKAIPNWTVGWDELAYHAAIPAKIVTSGSLNYTNFTYQAYFPISSELVVAWFMLPYSDDTFVSLTSLIWLPLAALSIYLIVHRVTNNSLQSVAGAFVCVASPLYLWQMSTFSATSAAAASLFMCSLAFLALSTRDSIDQKDLWANYIFSSIAAGLVLGFKASYLDSVVFLFMGWGVIFFKRAELGNFLVALAIGFAAVSLTGGVWYFRNLIATGNPFFPAEVLFFDGPFDREAISRTSLFFWMDHWFSDLVNIRKWYRSIVEPTQLPGVIAVAGVILVMFDIKKRYFETGYQTATDESSTLDLKLLILAIIVVLILLYPFQPFFAGGNRPYADFIPEIRRLSAAVLMGVLLFFLTAQNRVAQYCCIAFVGTLLVDMKFLFIASGILTLSLIMPRKIAIHFSPLFGSAVLLLVVSAALFFSYPVLKDYKTEVFFEGSDEKALGPVVKAVESLPGGSRITFIMSDPHMYTKYYPIFGRSLQHIPVAIDDDGTLLRPLHERWREEAEGWWSDWRNEGDDWFRFSPQVSSDQFVKNLASSDVEYVLVTTWSMSRWPPQYDLLTNNARVQKVFADDRAIIWRVPSIP